MQNHVLYRTAFEQAGFDVALLNNADGFFVEEVCDLKPQIISMDLMMGINSSATERDGFDAIDALKLDPRTRDIPIIVLTNFFEENKVRRAKLMGAVDFISVAGQSINKIPENYMRYLKKPKKYIPSHPIFRKT